MTTDEVVVGGHVVLVTVTASGDTAQRRQAALDVVRRAVGCSDGACSIEAGRGTQPVVVGHDVHVSWSSDGPTLVVAVAGVPVGVDAESSCPPRHERLDLARRHLGAMATLAQHVLPGTLGERSFLQAWMAREARGKVAGVGLGAVEAGPRMATRVCEVAGTSAVVAVAMT